MIDNEFVKWFIVLLVTNVTAIGASVLSWIKASRMMPRELEAADLDNKKSEAGIAESMETIAKNAAVQVIEYQARLAAQQKQIDALEKEIKDLNGIRAEVNRLREEIKRYKDENAALWAWNQDLQKQVAKFEPPAPMPKIGGKND